MTDDMSPKTAEFGAKTSVKKRFNNIESQAAMVIEIWIEVTAR